MLKKKHFLKNTKGTAAIEFALILPILFLLLSGVINFGLILINKTQLDAVVSSGMLYAFGVSGVPSAVNTAMNATVLKNLSLFGPLTTTVTQFCQCLTGVNVPCNSTCMGGSSPGVYDQVTASSSVSLIALDFVLTNPFPTTNTGIIRTDK